MIELFLNAARVALSEDARATASTLVSLAKKSPEWKKDLCTIDARVSHFDREQASLLVGLGVSKLENLKFRNDAIGDFEIVSEELTANAFEHGCKTPKSRIQIVIDVSEAYVALTVINPKGGRFNFDGAIKKCRLRMKRDPYAERGEGLVLVSELADRLEATERNDGLKAVLYRERVSLKTRIVNDLAVITVATRGSMFNPSFERRVLGRVREQADKDVILDLSALSSGRAPSGQTAKGLSFRRGRLTSVPRRTVLRAKQLQGPSDASLSKLGRLAGKSRGAIVALFDSQASPESSVNLPRSMVANSWEDALNKVGRPKLLSKLKPNTKSKKKRAGRSSR